MPPKREPPRHGGGGGGPGGRGTPGRYIVFGILLLSIAGILALALSAPWSESRRAPAGQTPLGSDDASTAPPSVARLEGASRPTRESPTATSPAQDPLRDLAEDEGPALVAAATALRSRLRLERSFLEATLTRLMDPGLDSETRARLAFVLGTLDLPGVEVALLASLERYAGDAAYLRSALLALGAQPGPADRDDVFDMGDRPYGVVGPGGLGITLRRELTSAAVKAALLGHLGHADESARYAAARSLGASAASAEVRDGLRAALLHEEKDAVAARVAEPLGRWAAVAPPGPERSVVLDLLLTQALRGDLDETRFRLEKDLGRIRLPEAGYSRLLDATETGATSAVRLSAITILGTSAARADAGTVERIRSRLADLVEADGDGSVRDVAARQLGRVPASGASRAALEKAATRDDAWNVRYTALESLAGFGDGPSLRRTLAAALEDGEPRVQDLAREILARLPDR